MKYSLNFDWTHEPTPKELEEYDSNYNKLIIQLTGVVDYLIKHACPGRVIIKQIDFFGDGISMHPTKSAFYRPSENRISFDRVYIDDFDKLVQSICHELSHAYQHQILPDYYRFNKKDCSNKGLHDDLQKEIEEYFKLIWSSK